MKPYSQDLREKIIQAIEAQEETQSDIADRFAVSLSFVEKLWRQWQTTGSCAAKPHAGGQSRRLRDHSETLQNAVSKQPDATLEELSDQIVEAKGPQVSRSTICRELQRLKLPLKKSLHASEQDTPRVERLRVEYRSEIKAHEVGQLKFIDEAGATLAMTRLYGRARPGERVVDSVPQNYGSSQTMLACLSLGGVSAPWVIEGAVDGEVFLTWVREVLGPTLQPGDVVVMDNLAAHKVVGVEHSITARGARLIYLSPYSPDFNPIERCWSKIKTFLRKAKARTIETLIEAIKQALATISKSDALAWFAHCGYTVH